MTDPGIEAFRRVTPEGELWGHTWTPQPQPTTRWWRAGELAAPPGNTDHYVSMGLTADDPTTVLARRAREVERENTTASKPRRVPSSTDQVRAKQPEVVALLAVAWADVDVVSPWHAKPGLATTHDEALGALTAAMMPTVALRTPGGVQGFWLCETAIELEPAAMRQHLSDVGATFQAHSDVVFDPVWNADRLMRLPGSVHYGSGEPVDVVTLWADGPWWDLDSLGARLVDAGAGQIMSRAATDAYRSIELPAMSQREAAAAMKMNPALFDAAEMICGAKLFAATWAGRRTDMKDNSASGHDMAVASWAVQIEGITDTEIAELVAARRAASGAKEKPRLTDYLRRTIANVRAGQKREQAVAHIEQAATAAADDITDAAVAGDVPPDPLGSLSKVLGVQVDRVIRRSVPDAPESTSWHLVSGGVVSGGMTAAQTASAAAMWRTIVASFDKVPPRAVMKPETWDMVLQLVLNVAEPEVLSDEADPVSLARHTLRVIADEVVDWMAKGGVPQNKGQDAAFMSTEALSALRQAAPLPQGAELRLRRDYVRSRMQDAKITDRDYGTAAASLEWVSERPTIEPWGRVYVWSVPLSCLS